MNFFPLLDININQNNPIINIRSFSDKTNIVSKYGIQMIKGMQKEGIISTAKHFPGHGNTEIDSHLGLPILNIKKEMLFNREMKPFKEAIINGVKNIMTAHIIFKEVDKENPATISKEILSVILRKKLNYKGLITSDSMEMKAISDGISTPVGVLKGLKAGIDLVCVFRKKSIYASIEKLKKAINDNILTMEEIDEKVKRILKYKKEVYSKMKYKYCIFQILKPPSRKRGVLKIRKISIIFYRFSIIKNKIKFVWGP